MALDGAGGDEGPGPPPPPPLLVALATLAGQHMELEVKAGALIGQAKAEAAALLGQPPEQQRWLLGERVLQDGEPLAGQIATSGEAEVQILCVFVPRMFPVLVKVIHFTPPALSETGPEVEVMVSPMLTVSAVKDDVAARAARRGARRLRLLKAGLEMQDDKVVSTYNLGAGDVLHCVMCRPRGSRPRDPEKELAAAGCDVRPQALEAAICDPHCFSPGVSPNEAYWPQPMSSSPCIIPPQPPTAPPAAARPWLGAKPPPATAWPPPRACGGEEEADEEERRCLRHMQGSPSACSTSGGSSTEDPVPSWELLTVLLALPDRELELSLPLDATVAAGKEAAEALCGTPKELQRWHVCGAPLREHDSLAECAPAAGGERPVRVSCTLMPAELPMVVQVLYFTTPADTEVGPELELTVPLLGTVAALKRRLAAELRLPAALGAPGLALLVPGGAEPMEDQRLVGAYTGVHTAGVLKCVVQQSALQRRPPPPGARR